MRRRERERGAVEKAQCAPNVNEEEDEKKVHKNLKNSQASPSKFAFFFCFIHIRSTLIKFIFVRSPSPCTLIQHFKIFVEFISIPFLTLSSDSWVYINVLFLFFCRESEAKTQDAGPESRAPFQQRMHDENVHETCSIVIHGSRSIPHGFGVSLVSPGFSLSPLSSVACAHTGLARR